MTHDMMAGGRSSAVSPRRPRVGFSHFEELGPSAADREGDRVWHKIREGTMEGIESIGGAGGEGGTAKSNPQKGGALEGDGGVEGEEKREVGVEAPALGALAATGRDRETLAWRRVGDPRQRKSLALTRPKAMSYGADAFGGNADAAFDSERKRSISRLLSKAALGGARRQSMAPSAMIYFKDYPEVTMVFSDVVGYTDMSSSMEARKVLGMLHDYFTRLDHVSFHCRFLFPFLPFSAPMSLHQARPREARRLPWRLLLTVLFVKLNCVRPC